MDLAAARGSRVTKVVPGVSDKEDRNLVLACWPCGQLKAGRSVAEFRDAYSFQVNSPFGIIPLAHGRTLRDAGLIRDWKFVAFAYEAVIISIQDLMYDNGWCIYG